ncbi:MAG TPA: CinA family protein [Actinocrinis sp.]|uniref:CinA family protein n=1 Tax=Actinocrinis sp. TaxID=1920516 RepID=UPI002DDD7772|nr:CinA family protein [Actinocrinis sp.]HEV2346519.1 CinA family protein [Actinocrinis sp.]
MTATEALEAPQPAEITRLVEQVLSRARYLRLTIAVAESLTGGQLAAAITAVPGASAVFRGSVTAYATDLKASVLGVDAALLAEVGAVHAEVARQMAEGVRRVCRADVGVATTGVAGPAPQDGRPVGTVFVAVAGPDSAQTEQRAFGCLEADSALDRARIQRLSTSAALRLTLRHLAMRTRS